MKTFKSVSVLLTHTYTHTSADKLGRIGHDGREEGLVFQDLFQLFRLDPQGHLLLALVLVPRRDNMVISPRK